MSEDLFIPQLGQTVEDVVLIGWLVEDGSKVDLGDPVLEVETDKAIFSVEANAKGYVHFGSFKMGETVPVLTVVATIGKEDEGFSPGDQKPKPETEIDGSATAVSDEKVQVHQKEKKEAQDTREREKIFASPRAKKLAQEENVDLSMIDPTGGDGIRVVEEDVLNYLQTKPSPSATPIAAKLAQDVGMNLSDVAGTGPMGTVTRSDVEKAIRSSLSAGSSHVFSAAPAVKYADIRVKETTPLRSIRKRIFDHMTASDQLTTRVTLITEVDATDLVVLREKLKSEKAEIWGFTPGYNDLIGKIVTRVLQEHPYMNARLSEDGENIEQLAEINLGIAVDTARGLVVPVIKGADGMDLQALGTGFRQLVEAIQLGQVSPDDLSGGTFTITNLGNFDVDAFTPVINLPEIAILGLGRVQEKVVPFQGEIKVRKMMTLSLVFDHRLVDGAPAARFLQRVKEYIEYPILIFV